MTIREKTERWEHQAYSRYASYSDQSRGREVQEAPCEIRTVYQRDRDRILHSKAFRRLKHKTQVFLLPEDDHYRTRMTHTLEVAQVSRTIAKALRLNEELTEAIAYGHDLGHTPFGHSGEYVLDEKMREIGLRFRHSEQSVRVVELLEKNGEGLNLTWEVRDGIRNHGTAGKPATPEGKIVRISDKIAYINHDIDDAIRAGVLREEDIPSYYTDILGHSVRERLDFLVKDMIHNNMDTGDIRQSERAAEAMMGLRDFMFAYVYKNKVVKAEEVKAQAMLKMLYEYYVRNWEALPHEYVRMVVERQMQIEVVVCDYIAGMTDQYATDKFKELFVPRSWK